MITHQQWEALCIEGWLTCEHKYGTREATKIKMLPSSELLLIGRRRP